MVAWLVVWGGEVEAALGYGGYVGDGVVVGPGVGVVFDFFGVGVGDDGEDFGVGLDVALDMEEVALGGELEIEYIQVWFDEAFSVALCEEGVGGETQAGGRGHEGAAFGVVPEFSSVGVVSVAHEGVAEGFGLVGRLGVVGQAQAVA